MTLNEKQHVVKTFDKDLKNLHNNILDMARAVHRQLDDAGDALVQLSAETAEQVMARDALINTWEKELDAFMELLISRRQPQAIDLRMLLGCYRMTADFERLGDEIRNAAKGIRKLALPLSDEAKTCAGSLMKVHGLLEVMADDSVAALETVDADRARTLVRRREVVQSEVRGMLVETIEKMKSGKIEIDNGLEFIRINRAFDRVAAHLQNIGEAVVFISEGLDIRHDAAK
ncbi:phosphate signaling complex protein PhoU [Sutterella sp.]|uniref:phosphate signaling complex protein PhoU n=1 Tax=Sutterella sp. TaxID=1981025 RepID=UPI0026E0E026|nr:phosphate signaling complex protein PhoU [Sutterella sp.]MDO5530548.1 phosphate signaling complex protein PhoU [Sutterella sp.]